jgi:hypothetical protein
MAATMFFVIVAYCCSKERKRGGEGGGKKRENKKKKRLMTQPMISPLGCFFFKFNVSRGYSFNNSNNFFSRPKVINPYWDSNPQGLIQLLTRK